MAAHGVSPKPQLVQFLLSPEASVGIPLFEKSKLEKILDR